MAKVTLTDLTSLANDTSATNSINQNFQAIEDYINNQSLSRNAGGEVNLVLNDIDFNGYDIQNLGDIDIGGTPLSTYVNNAAASAAAAATSETNAAASETNAEAQVTLAAAQVTLAQAEVANAAAEVVLAQAEVANAQTEVTYAEEWANKAEDSLISVAAGGDGSTEYSARHWAAKAELSAGVDLNAQNAWTASQVAATYTNATTTGNETLDFSEYNNFILTLTGNTTLVNPGDATAGQTGFISVTQDGTGSRTITLGTEYETPGGTGVTLTGTASSTDLIPYIVISSSRILLGTPILDFS